MIHHHALGIVTALLLLSLSTISAWMMSPSITVPNKYKNHIVVLHMQKEEEDEHPHPPHAELPSPSRRDFFGKATAGTTLAAAVSSVCPSRSASATMMKSDSAEANVFKTGENMGVEEAKKRFVLARQDLQYLLTNYDDISKGGGDAVRRYLGTVGVTSYMYGIGKVLKELREESDDIVEYTEQMNEFNAYLNQAETSAYMSLFVEHSSAKSTPESLLKTSRDDATMMLQYMDEIATQLQL